MKYGYAYFVLFSKRKHLEERLELCVQNKMVNSINNLQEDLVSLDNAMELMVSSDTELKDALGLDKTK